MGSTVLTWWVLLERFSPLYWALTAIIFFFVFSLSFSLFPEQLKTLDYSIRFVRKRTVRCFVVYFLCFLFVLHFKSVCVCVFCTEVVSSSSEWVSESCGRHTFQMLHLPPSLLFTLSSIVYLLHFRFAPDWLLCSRRFHCESLAISKHLVRFFPTLSLSLPKLVACPKQRHTHIHIHLPHQPTNINNQHIHCTLNLGLI